MSNTLDIDYQRILRDRLLNDEQLVTIPVFTAQEAITLKISDQYEEQQNIISYGCKNVRPALLGTAGAKMGASIVILEPEANDANPNTLAGPDDLFFDLLVFEILEYNRGPDGSGIPAIQIARIIKENLKLFQAVGFASPLVPRKPYLLHSRDFSSPDDNLWAYRVRFQTRTSQASSRTKVAIPTISPAGGAHPQTVTLTCATPGASIYYNATGIYPTAETGQGSLYTAPFSFQSAGLIAAIAIKTGMIDSDLNTQQFT